MERLQSLIHSLPEDDLRLRRISELSAGIHARRTKMHSIASEGQPCLWTRDHDVRVGYDSKVATSQVIDMEPGKSPWRNLKNAASQRASQSGNRHSRQTSQVVTVTGRFEREVTLPKQNSAARLRADK